MSVSQYLLFRRTLLLADGNRAQQILANKDTDRIAVENVYLPKGLEQIWAGQKQFIAYQGLIAKYVQNVQLCEQLLDTGSAVIAACLPQDTLWGNGLEVNDSAVGEIELWPGQNLLGFALMQVRSALCSTRQF